MNLRRNGKSCSSDMTYGGPRISPFAMSISKWAMTLSFSCWYYRTGTSQITHNEAMNGRKRGVVGEKGEAGVF